MSSNPSSSPRLKNRLIRELSRTRTLTFIMTVFFLILFAEVGRSQFGSIANAILYVRGDRLLVDDPVKLIGDVGSGDQIRIQYTFTNWSKQNTRILGAKTSCTCVVVDDLPTSISPGESRAINVMMAVPNEGSNVHQKITIYSNSLRRGELTLEVVGRAVPGRRSPGSAVP